MKFRKPVLATELKVGGSNERFLGANGEINASSRKDLMTQIANYLDATQTQDIVTEKEAVQREQHKQALSSLLTASFTSGQAHKELGEVLAEDLFYAGNREGFARRFLTRQELKQGEIPRVKMRLKNVTAVVATGPTKVETQITQDNHYMPSEIDIITRPYVTKREIDQSLSDVVDEKYVEALEGIMVAEDRLWKKMALATVGIDNPLTNVAGTFTPAALAGVANHVRGFQIPARFLLMANDLWTDMVSDNQWMNVVDPVSKYEILRTGQLGTVYGMDIISDAYRHPQHRVLDKGEFFVVGDPINHGTITDRGGVDSTPIDGTTEGVLGRGWLMSETISMVIANSRSVARGLR